MNDFLVSLGKTVLGVVAAAPAAYVANPAHPTLANLPEAYVEGLCLLGAVVGGAYASFGWGDPVEPRSKMFRLFVSCVIVGLGFTLTVNWLVEFFNKTGLTIGVKVGIGIIVSCLTRFVMPKVIEAIKDGTWRDLIPFIRKKGT